jgi:hypothetical protein
VDRERRDRAARRRDVRDERCRLNAAISPSLRCFEYQMRSGSPATPARKSRVSVARMIDAAGGAMLTSTAPFSGFVSRSSASSSTRASSNVGT